MMDNETFILKRRGIDYSVLNPADYGIDFYSDILFTSEQEVKEHPLRVQAMLRASLKGWRYALDHPGEMIDLLQTKYKVPKSREHLQYEAEAMQPLIEPDLIEIGHMNRERWERMAQAFIDLGIGSENFSLDDFIYQPHPTLQIKKLQKILIFFVIVSGAALLVAVCMLCGWARLKHEVALRRIAEAQVKQLAYYDPLTAIPNRNSFMPYANKQIHSALRNRQKLAFCFIDLNRFKELNNHPLKRVGSNNGLKVRIRVD
ncbi:ABC transporter substrate-binding protein [Methylomarinum vadi]|uniref:ABC transporter substrate-binding protein n=1 Tax=Methylomarinum vadi TaxID=438855 RepID=UPI00068D2902|nr:ABC transporter substrate-binding protein [Methylomarinum vadi]